MISKIFGALSSVKTVVKGLSSALGFASRKVRSSKKNRIENEGAKAKADIKKTVAKLKRAKTDKEREEIIDKL